MSTRAVITFIDKHERFAIYRHGDGYPDGEHGAVESIKKAFPFAWPLNETGPMSFNRFEPRDFSAAYVRANKNGPGDIYLTTSAEDHGDLAYSYEVRFVSTMKYIGLEVKIFDADGDLIETHVIETVKRS